MARNPEFIRKLAMTEIAIGQTGREFNPRTYIFTSKSKTQK